MNDVLTSWVRTLVPAAWSSVISLAVVHGALPGDAAASARSVAGPVLVPFVLAVVYAGLRWLETQSWMPRWLTTVLLGDTRTPTYPAPAPPPSSTPPSSDG